MESMLPALAGEEPGARRVQPRKQETMHRKSRRNFEIARILHLKSEIRNLKLDGEATSISVVQFEISDFGFEMQDSCDFKIPSLTGLPEP